MGEELHPKLNEVDLIAYNNKLHEEIHRANMSRNNEIKSKIEEMKRLYERYNKLKKKWSSWESVIMVSGMILTGAVSAAVTIFIPVFGAVIGTIGGFSAFEIISYIGVHQLIKRKTAAYKQHCSIIKCYLDRLYLLYLLYIV